jgi:hypothetical protein
MKAKDIFNLAVRLLGLYFIYLAAKQVPVLFAASAGASQIFFPVILTVAVYLGVAWWLLGGAPLLVKRAYPEASSQQPSGEISDEKAKADA